MIPRSASRPVALVVALALAAALGLVAVEIAFGVADAEPLILDWPSWYRRARTEAWASAPLRITAFVVGLLGLLLLALAWWPRRAETVEAVDEADVAVRLNRRDLLRSTGRAVGRVDGVSRVRVRAMGRRARLTGVALRAETTRSRPGDLRSRVAAAADVHLDRLGVGGLATRADVRTTRSTPGAEQVS